MNSLKTFIALNRFGLGPKRGEADKVASNPKNWVKNQIRRDQKTPKILSRFRASAEIIEDLETARNKTSNKKKRQLPLKPCLNLY